MKAVDNWSKLITSGIRHPDHDKKCWLNNQAEGHITVPCWCTCPTHSQNRIEELTELLIEKGVWNIFWLTNKLLPGEFEEVNKRIENYISTKNKEGW